MSEANDPSMTFEVWAESCARILDQAEARAGVPQSLLATISDCAGGCHTVKLKMTLEYVPKGPQLGAQVLPFTPKEIH